MATPITASMLYDLVHCPHRVFLDLYGDRNEKDPTSPFVELLWERGTAYEREVIEGLEQPFTDLSTVPREDRERLTDEAIARGDPLIYRGRIAVGDLLGEPDLLRRSGEAYIAGDIKSGSGEEGGSDAEEGRPKTHYAVQLALYTDILERKRVSAGRAPFVWDIHGREVPYSLNEPPGPRTRNTLWQTYEGTREEARGIVERTHVTRPAWTSACKLCHWHSKCYKELESADDLTLIPELGRSRRDAMVTRISTVRELASVDLANFISGDKTVFPRIGVGTLRLYQHRAQLQIEPHPEPYLLEPIPLPTGQTELVFDIETDPLQDLCYLHGFLVRRDERNDMEQYTAFFAETPDSRGEEAAFAGAVEFIRAHMPCVIYYYASYERIWCRTLQERYPAVVAADEVEGWLQAPVGIDLYREVVDHTIWPTHDHSLKTLAAFLKFKWRDTDPSGAASIEWYDQWVKSGDASIKQRILEYNEDDCRATRVLLDGISSLRVRPYPV